MKNVIEVFLVQFQHGNTVAICNKAGESEFFGFPIHMKVILYRSLLCNSSMCKQQCTHLNLKILYC